MRQGLGILEILDIDQGGYRFFGPDLLFIRG